MKPLIRAFALLALLISVGAAAQYSGEPSVGRHYWYLPKHDNKYAPLDFYREPSFKSIPYRFIHKQQFEIVGARKGWLALRFRSDYGAPKGFVRNSDFRTRMYRRLEFTNSLEKFRSASIFEEDPDVIRARLEKEASAAALRVPRKTVSEPKTKAKWWD